MPVTSPASQIKEYKRVMIKISGEALMGDQAYGLNPPTVENIAKEIKKVHSFQAGGLSLMISALNCH